MPLVKPWLAAEALRALEGRQVVGGVAEDERGGDASPSSRPGQLVICSQVEEDGGYMKISDGQMWAYAFVTEEAMRSKPPWYKAENCLVQLAEWNFSSIELCSGFTDLSVLKELTNRPLCVQIKKMVNLDAVINDEYAIPSPLNEAVYIRNRFSTHLKFLETLKQSQGWRTLCDFHQNLVWCNSHGRMGNGELDWDVLPDHFPGNLQIAARPAGNFDEDSGSNMSADFDGVFGLQYTPQLGSDTSQSDAGDRHVSKKRGTGVSGSKTEAAIEKMLDAEPETQAPDFDEASLSEETDADTDKTDSIELGVKHLLPCKSTGGSRRRLQQGVRAFLGESTTEEEHPPPQHGRNSSFESIEEPASDKETEEKHAAHSIYQSFMSRSDGDVPQPQPSTEPGPERSLASNQGSLTGANSLEKSLMSKGDDSESQPEPEVGGDSSSQRSQALANSMYKSFMCRSDGNEPEPEPEDMEVIVSSQDSKAAAALMYKRFMGRSDDDGLEPEMCPTPKHRSTCIPEISTPAAQLKSSSSTDDDDGASDSLVSSYAMFMSRDA